MASKRIEGITLEIGGDLSGLNKAIKGANKEINAMQRELKGVDSLLKLDPGNVELLTQKEKLLNEAIGKTEDKLADLRKAKEEADKTMAEGGKVNEEAYRNLQREIVATEKKLENLEQEQKEFGSVAKQQLEQTAQKFQQVGDKISGVGKAFAPVSGAAAAALTGLGGLAVKAGQTADEINTLAKTTGIATDELQRLKYGSDLVDVSLETIAGSMKKLKSNMLTAADGKGAASVFAELGIEVKNADGSLRDSNEVFYEIIDALGAMTNETERDAYAMKIFGKSATDLNPLIMAGSDAFAEAAENATIMTQSQLDAANALNDVIDQTKATVGSAALALGASLGETLLPVIEQIGAFIQNIAEKMGQLNPQIVTAIAIVLGIVAAVSPVLIIVGKLITAVGTIIKIIPALKTAIMGVNAVMAANPIGIVIVAVGLLIGWLVKLWQTNEEFRAKVIGVWEKVKAFFSKYSEWIAGILFGPIIGWLVHLWKTNDEFRAKVIAAWESIKAFLANLPEWLRGQLQKFVSIGKNIVEGIWNGIKNAKDWLLGKIREWCQGILNGIKSFFGIKSPSTVMRDEVGAMIAEGVAEGIEDNADLAIDAMAGLYDGIMDTDFTDAFDGFSDAANIAVDASYQQSDELLDKIATQTAQFVAQALLDGLIGIENTILQSMPQTLQLNVNGRQLAETTWADFDAIGNLKSRLFAPTRQTIASIAANAVNNAG